MALSRRLPAAAALLALVGLVQCQLTHDTDGLASVRPGGEGGGGGPSAGGAGSGEGGQEAAGLSGASGQAGKPAAGQGGATAGKGGGGGTAGAPCGGIGETCCVPDGTTATCKNLKAHCCLSACADKGDYRADGVCKRCCARCPGANGARVFLDLQDGKSCQAEADVFCKSTAATADWIDKAVCE